jgi:alcohol dehydrogenase class IV
MQPGLYSYLPQERVVWGRPAAEAVAAEVERRGAARVFLLASRSLATATGVVAGVEQALPGRVVGRFFDCVQHTPRESVLAAAQAVRAAAPDLIVTLGGGTPIDTGKILQICLAHDARRIEDLDALHIRVLPDGTRHLPAIKPSPVRQIVVPTTLSGAEFSALGAATDRRTGAKQAYVGPDVCAAAVILDPAVTLHTPAWLWLSTGIRAVDHAVEALCSIDPTPFTDGLSLHALKLFAQALPASRRAPGDLAARLACQQAVWLAAASINRVNYGASHGIGHVLGGLADVPHGYTSCALLPAVLAWNEPATGRQQAAVAAALDRPGVPAATAVKELIAGLGLPTSLRDLKVDPALLPRVAEAAMTNLWVRTNPRPIAGPAEVREILELAW